MKIYRPKKREDVKDTDINCKQDDDNNNDVKRKSKESEKKAIKSKDQRGASRGKEKINNKL